MRYFIAFFITLLIIFSLIFLIFHGGGKPKSVVATRTLESYALTDAEAKMTIDGPINADSLHQQIQVIVSNTTVTFEQIQGYNGQVVNTQSFANTDNAYTNFLFALARAGFTQGDNSSTLSDERGYCPLGERYIFEFSQDGKDLERYWATSCGKPKTYLGALNLTITLFQMQVPGYGTLAQPVGF